MLINIKDAFAEDGDEIQQIVHQLYYNVARPNIQDICNSEGMS